MTTAPVTVGNVHVLPPEFSDTRGVSHLFHVGRSLQYRLIREGKIRSVLLRQPGRRVGKRLIHVDSVREFLAKEMAAQKKYVAGVCNANETGKRS